MSDAVQLAASQPQLGILSVAATLECCGDRPDIVDVNREYLRYARMPGALQTDAFADHLAEIAIRSNADLYGFSSICSTYPLSIRVARAVKLKRPFATILLGGPQASVVDIATMTAFPFVDYVLRGEVERTLPLLMQQLQGDYDFSQIGGLTYREGTTIKRNSNAEIIEDLDQLPPPAYHLSNYLKGSKAASIELGRGCPFSCTFCSTNDFFRRKFRLRSPSVVLRDMRAIAATYGIRHFELVHDMFTVDRRRVVAFCEEMLTSSEGLTWDCSARTDCVDAELLELMARSGCRGIFFGIETGSRKMQRVIDKDLDLDRAKEMLEIANRLEIRTTASLITGFPEEDWDDVRETINIFMHSARCAHSNPQLNLLAPLAGTPIHTAHKHEMVLEDICSDMSHQGLSQNKEDLELIRTFPDIFPNYYLIPVKALDRDTLFELREFLSMAIERFRWLLCAVDAATDMLQFLEGWRSWRTVRRGSLIGSDLRRFYAGNHFCGDFFQFMRHHPLWDQPAIGALVRAEETLRTAAERMRSACTEGSPIAVGEPLQLNDVPSSKVGTQTLQLEFKLEEIVRALSKRTTPQPDGPTFYATRLNERGDLSLVEISNTLAMVISACDGKRTVAEMLDHLTRETSNADMDVMTYFLREILTGAQALAFIEVHRVAPLEEQALIKSL